MEGIMSQDQELPPAHFSKSITHRNLARTVATDRADFGVLSDEPETTGPLSSVTRPSTRRSSASRSSTSRSSRRLARIISLSIVLPLLTLGLFGLCYGQKKDSCVECHSQMEGELLEPVTHSKDDIHFSRGLSCSSCHGGDPTQDDPTSAMNKGKGFVGKPAPKDIPNFCGKCHSNADFMKKFNPSLRVDQQKEYLTSVHGKLLESGDQKVATCISCHGVHGIRGVKDAQALVYPLNVADTCGKCHSNAEYMAGYSIPHDQFANYKASVHARALYERQDLSAPTCNSCHGNHGAAPPGLASVANVCGQCHVRQSELFQASVHKTAFDTMQVGECKQCHSNHKIVPPGDFMIGTAEGSVCTSCHIEGDGGYVAARQIRGMIDNLSGRMDSAMAVLGKAERAGMEVSRPKFELSDARNSLTNARVLVHSFSVDEVEKVIKPGLETADRSEKAGNAALADLTFRRKGLGVSLFFILFVAVLIYIKVRQLESRHPGAESKPN